MLYSSYNLWEELVNFVHFGYFFIDLWVVDFLSLVSFVYFLRLNDPPSRMEYFNSEELSVQPCVKTLHIIFRCHTWRWLGGGKRETVILLSEFSLAQSKPVTQHLKDPFTWKLDRVFCFQIHFTWISNETYFVLKIKVAAFSFNTEKSFILLASTPFDFSWQHWIFFSKTQTSQCKHGWQAKIIMG